MARSRRGHLVDRATRRRPRLAQSRRRQRASRPVRGQGHSGRCAGRLRRDVEGRPGFVSSAAERGRRDANLAELVLGLSGCCRGCRKRRGLRRRDRALGREGFLDGQLAQRLPTHCATIERSGEGSQTAAHVDGVRDDDDCYGTASGPSDHLREAVPARPPARHRSPSSERSWQFL